MHDFTANLGSREQDRRAEIEFSRLCLDRAFLQTYLMAQPTSQRVADMLFRLRATSAAKAVHSAAGPAIFRGRGGVVVVHSREVRAPTPPLRCVNEMLCSSQLESPQLSFSEVVHQGDKEFALQGWRGSIGEAHFTADRASVEAWCRAAEVAFFSSEAVEEPSTGPRVSKRRRR